MALIVLSRLLALPSKL
ncbi:hypothetical protein SUNI508_13078 [Seiridium unicorne]|uniref:Uncharacterized protein n=1 Tax=Seiridium unicorne TaxID=138068 RepID=A0ABR2VER2_9PEZI